MKVAQAYNGGFVFSGVETSRSAIRVLILILLLCIIKIIAVLYLYHHLTRRNSLQSMKLAIRRE
jgi:hypothetical protein